MRQALIHIMRGLRMRDDTPPELVMSNAIVRLEELAYSVSVAGHPHRVQKAGGLRTNGYSRDDQMMGRMYHLEKAVYEGRCP